MVSGLKGYGMGGWKGDDGGYTYMGEDTDKVYPPPRMTLIRWYSTMHLPCIIGSRGLIWSRGSNPAFTGQWLTLKSGCQAKPGGIFVLLARWEDALLDWLKIYTLVIKLLNFQSRLVFVLIKAGIIS